MDIKNFKIPKKIPYRSPIQRLADEIYEYVPKQDQNSKTYRMILGRIKNMRVPVAQIKWADLMGSKFKYKFEAWMSKDKK